MRSALQWLGTTVRVDDEVIDLFYGAVFAPDYLCDVMFRVNCDVQAGVLGQKLRRRELHTDWAGHLITVEAALASSIEADRQRMLESPHASATGGVDHAASNLGW